MRRRDEAPFSSRAEPTSQRARPEHSPSRNHSVLARWPVGSLANLLTFLSVDIICSATYSAGALLPFQKIPSLPRGYRFAPFLGLAILRTAGSNKSELVDFSAPAK